MICLVLTNFSSLWFHKKHPLFISIITFLPGLDNVLWSVKSSFFPGKYWDACLVTLHANVFITAMLLWNGAHLFCKHLGKHERNIHSYNFQWQGSRNFKTASKSLSLYAINSDGYYELYLHIFFCICSSSFMSHNIVYQKFRQGYIV